MLMSARTQAASSQGWCCAMLVRKKGDRGRGQVRQVSARKRGRGNHVTHTNTADTYQTGPKEAGAFESEIKVLFELAWQSLRNFVEDPCCCCSRAYAQFSKTTCMYLARSRYSYLCKNVDSLPEGWWWWGRRGNKGAIQANIECLQLSWRLACGWRLGLP